MCQGMAYASLGAPSDQNHLLPAEFHLGFSGIDFVLKVFDENGVKKLKVEVGLLLITKRLV